jgi:hypothetical protein
MNIYAKQGHKVKYLGENGYDSNRAAIEKLGVKVGDILTVQFTEVYSSSTDVYFEEVAGYHNSVMFEDVE